MRECHVCTGLDLGCRTFWKHGCAREIRAKPTGGDSSDGSHTACPCSPRRGEVGPQGDNSGPLGSGKQGCWAGKQQMSVSPANCHPSLIFFSSPVDFQ